MKLGGNWLWFLKNHDFIHVNSTVAGKYNKHKQDGIHLRFPIRMILATVDLQVTSILPIKMYRAHTNTLGSKFDLAIKGQMSTEDHHFSNFGRSPVLHNLCKD